MKVQHTFIDVVVYADKNWRNFIVKMNKNESHLYIFYKGRLLRGGINILSNPFEAFWNTIKLSMDNMDEPKHPMHTGEVTSCWVYYTALKEFIRYEEVGLNTTDDDEVKEMLVDALKLCQSQAKRLEDFLIQEGVPLPDLPASKPKSEGNEVPLGAKFTDDEITNGVSVKVAVAIVECATGQAQAIRSDISLMWVEFQTELGTFGATLKSLMRKRGWIRIPPYYYPPGSPNN